MNITVAGSGAWGTALAVSLVQNGHDTMLWSHDPKKAEILEKTRRNIMLPEILLPEQLKISSDVRCVEASDLVVIACPSFPIRSVCRSLAPHLGQDTVMVSVTKGIEAQTLLRMSQIVEAETHRPTAALTGPSHAEEVARNIPTGCLAAHPDQKLAELVQSVFMSETLRVYTSPDIIGAELCGALKNVIALCAGVSDGLGYGDNTKAMLMTRGLTEIARLGVAMGASRDTCAGLAGVGDLIVTCTSMHSRNRRAGILIGQGKSPAEAMREVGAVVEGYYAARSAWELAGHLGVEMPIVQAAYSVLYENMPAREAVQALLLRQKRSEPEDSGWAI